MPPLPPAPVNAHLGFALILVALAWPPSRLLSRLILRPVPEEVQPDNASKYLDQGDHDRRREFFDQGVVLGRGDDLTI